MKTFSIALAGLSLVCVSALSLPAAATGSDALEVQIDPSGGIRAKAHVGFPANPAIIQSILTDYSHWPDLFEVRMRVVDLKIHDGMATTDLRIQHSLLPGERRLVTQSTSLPEGGLVTELLEGDFKKYHRAWKLAASNDGTYTLADFELLVAIDSVVPDWLVALAIRRELEAHFRIVKEKALARANLGK